MIVEMMMGEGMCDFVAKTNVEQSETVRNYLYFN